MENESINVTLTHQIKIQVDSEIEKGGFANADEFLNELVGTHFERQRIMKLVAEGLADKELSPVDWTEMSAELENYINENRDSPQN